MNCLLCNEPARTAASWTGLFSARSRPVVCAPCRSGFEAPNGQPPLAEWKGTPYEGALDGARALFAYNEPMKQFLHQYKFLRDAALARVFSGELADAVSKSGGRAVAIPVHPDRLKERTFPHVEELLRQARIPHVEMLEKTASVTLGKMNRQERMALDLLFRLRTGIQKAPGEYVLVDDLYTTGTTLHHAAAVLKQAGADRVTAVTLIRA
ncbi:ComF family protein [Bhargavaea ullalensis]|uniref:Competence protein ComFC n=1 Tax=Bhargavaea ullalensis TaxID=1265685 RepID=A0ABV2GEU4_9BACL